MTKQSRAQNQSVEDEPRYFDLHTRGIGYLNRVRWVEPKGRRADRFLACEVNALHGETEEARYTKFDLIVTGEDAIDLVANSVEDVEAKRKVLVWFTIGDIWTHTYMRDELDSRTRRPTGRQIPAAVIKGRLLRIARMKVDGQVVYEASKPESGQDESPREPQGDPMDDLDEAQPAASTSRHRGPANDEAVLAPTLRDYGGGQGRGRDSRPVDSRPGYPRRTGTHG